MSLYETAEEGAMLRVNEYHHAEHRTTDVGADTRVCGGRSSHWGLPRQRGKPFMSSSNGFWNRSSIAVSTEAKKGSCAVSMGVDIYRLAESGCLKGGVASNLRVEVAVSSVRSEAAVTRI